MNNNNSKAISDKIQVNHLNNDIKEKVNEISNLQNSLPSNNYEYVTKGRKTLYNSSHINLESPKKQNPSRSKRLSLLNKGNIDNNMSNTTIELFSFGKEMFGSKKKLRKRENEQSKSLNLNYKLLIKRIAAQLKKRVKLPTCKIIKIYQPYRELVFRIARGIKKTIKNNNKEIDKDIKRDKYEMKLLLKEEDNNSKKNEMNLQPKERQEMEDNTNYLLSIDDSIQNNNFINQFEKFLEINNIEISDFKVPSFNNENNKYLLSNLFFWIKYIKYICQKYKNNLSFFNFMNFIEVFYAWIDVDKYDCTIFNRLIIEQMELAFNKNEVNNFLLMHKLKSIDDLFLRYKNMNNYNEVLNQKNCQCPSCLNIQQKVINYNKKYIYISYSEENNLAYTNEIIKFPESKTKFDDKNLGLSINKVSNSNTNETKDDKIPHFFRWSRELKPLKKISPNKIVQNNDDKRITDYFVYTKIQNVGKEKKEKKEEKKSSNKSKSNKKRNKKSSDNKKNNKKNNDKKGNNNKKKISVKDIFKLLNIES